MVRRKFDQVRKDGTTKIDRGKRNEKFVIPQTRSHRQEDVPFERQRKAKLPSYSPLDDTVVDTNRLKDLFLSNGKINRGFKFSDRNNATAIISQVMDTYKSNVKAGLVYDRKTKQLSIDMDENTNSMIEPDDIIDLAFEVAKHHVDLTDRVKETKQLAEIHIKLNEFGDLKREYLSKEGSNKGRFTIGTNIDSELKKLDQRLETATAVTRELASMLTLQAAKEGGFREKLTINKGKDKLFKEIQAIEEDYQKLLDKVKPSAWMDLRESEEQNYERMSKQLDERKTAIEKAIKDTPSDKPFRSEILGKIASRIAQFDLLFSDNPDPRLIGLKNNPNLIPANGVDTIKERHGQVMNYLLNPEDDQYQKLVRNKNEIEKLVNDKHLGARPHLKVIFNPDTNRYETVLTRPYRNDQIEIHFDRNKMVLYDPSLEPIVKKAIIGSSKLKKLELDSILSSIKIDMSDIPLARRLNNDEREMIENLITALNQDGFNGEEVVANYILGVADIDIIPDKHQSAMKLLKDFRNTYEIEKQKIITAEKQKIIDRYRLDSTNFIDQYDFEFLMESDEHIATTLKQKFDYRRPVNDNDTTETVVNYGVALGLFEVVGWDETTAGRLPNRIVLKDGSNRDISFKYGDPTDKLRLIDIINGKVNSENETIDFKKRAILLKMNDWDNNDLYRYSHLFQFPMDASIESRNKRKEFLDSLDDRFFKEMLETHPEYYGVFGLDEVETSLDRTSGDLLGLNLTDYDEDAIVGNFKAKVYNVLVDRYAIQNAANRQLLRLREAIEAGDKKKAQKAIEELSANKEGVEMLSIHFSNDPAIPNAFTEGKMYDMTQMAKFLTKDIFAEVLANSTTNPAGDRQLAFDLTKQLETQSTFEGDEFQDYVKQPKITQDELNQKLLAKINSLEMPLVTGKDALDIPVKDQPASNGSATIDQREVNKILSSIPKKEVDQVKKQVDRKIEKGGPTPSEDVQAQINKVEASRKPEATKKAEVKKLKKVKEELSEREELITSIKDINDEVLEGSSNLLDELEELKHTQAELDFASELNTNALQLNSSLEIMSALTEVDQENLTEADEALFTKEYVRTKKLLNGQINKISEVLPMERLDASDFTKAGIARKEFFNEQELRRRGATATDIRRFKRNYPNIAPEQMFQVLTQLIITDNDIDALAKDVIPKGTFRTRKKVEPIEFKRKRRTTKKK